MQGIQPYDAFQISKFLIADDRGLTEFFPAVRKTVANAEDFVYAVDNAVRFIRKEI